MMLREFLHLSLLFSLVHCAAVEIDEEPCKLRDGNNLYDLNSLASNKDYIIKTPENSSITLNICRPVVSEGWHLGDVDQAKVAGLVTKSRGDFSIGQVNTTISIKTIDSDLPTLKMILSEGSECPSGDGRGYSVINFICAADSKQNQPRLVAQVPEDNEDACVWVFEWQTPAACANSVGGGGIGSFFVSVLSTILILGLLYLVLGTLYNRFVLNLTGPAQIPQFSLESAKYHCTQFLFLLMDWYEKMRHNTSSRNTPGQTNPVSHHAQSQPVPPDATAPAEDGFGFVRPNPKTRTASAAKTNPFSHQSAVLAAQTRTQEQGTREEREFMLGDNTDDDDDDEQASTPVPTSNHNQPTSTDAGAPQPSSGEEAVQLRGRNTTEGEIVRL